MLRELPSYLINQIAAGEVIERPSSAIKELVENSIDAGAGSIEVIFHEAGKNYIRIKDDGLGINKDDLPKAICRHVTSKLYDDDLLNIKTMGFRGEALPSIASVSRFKITSKTKEQNDAWSIEVEGGRASELKPASINDGTIVEVRDLFFATPARLKFLKSNRSESSAIVDVLQRLAMANPYVSFKLQNESKVVFNYQVIDTEDIEKARITRLQEILRKEFSENSLPIFTQKNDITISGFVSVPTLNRATSDKQFLFVNNRPIRDRLVLGAIRGGYQGLIADGRSPMVAIYIDIPYNMVDVNAHPAKTEVRFSDAQEIRGLIVNSIREALNSSGLGISDSSSRKMLKSLSGSVSYENKQGDIFSSNFESNKANYQVNKLFSKADKSNNKTWQNYQKQEVSQASDLGYGAEVLDVIEDENTQKLPLGVAKAQLYKTYIIAQSNEGLIIVDQHAAHERLVHQKIEQSLLNADMEAQHLLLPEVFEDVDNSAFEKLIEMQKEFTKMGLIYEVYGENTLILRAIPAILDKSSARQLIIDLIDEIKKFGADFSLQQSISEICATIACHSSIRAGRNLNADEMDYLLRQMEATPNSGQCSHGRPTWVKLKKQDIEKLFGRS